MPMLSDDSTHQSAEMDPMAILEYQLQGLCSLARERHDGGVNLQVRLALD